MTPLGNYILVELEENPKSTASGLHLPDSARDSGPRKGKVVAVGPGPYAYDQIQHTPQVVAGDRVLFHADSYTETRDFVEEGGKKLYFVSHYNLLAKLPPV